MNHIWKGLIGVGLLMGTTLSAAILIEDGLGTLPTLDFETYDIDGGVSSTRAGSKDNRDNTQSFTLLSDITVGKFVLSINDAADGASVTFRLFNVTSGANADPLVTGSEIISESYTFTSADAAITSNSGDSTTEDNLLTWDIADTVLTSGVYALQIDGPATGPASGVYVGWRASGADPYSGGALYRDGLGETFGGSQDQTLGIIAIPEPGSLALFAISGLVFVTVRRRKRA